MKPGFLGICTSDAPLVSIGAFSGIEGVGSLDCPSWDWKDEVEMEGEGVVLERVWAGRAAKVVVSPLMLAFVCYVDLRMCCRVEVGKGPD